MKMQIKMLCGLALSLFVATAATAKKTKEAAPVEGSTCPVCKQGTVIKGKTAYGCSRWKEGCNYRVPFKS